MENCVILLLNLKNSSSEWRMPEIDGCERLWTFNLAPDSPGRMAYTKMNVYHAKRTGELDPASVTKALKTPEATRHVSSWTCHLYRRVSELRRTPSSGTPPILVSSGFTIQEQPELLEDFHRWYAEEHMPGMSRLSGWMAGSRYQRVSSLGAPGDVPPAEFIALHEWQTEHALGGEEWKKVVFTPWTDRILKSQAAPMQRSKWVAAD